MVRVPVLRLVRHGESQANLQRVFDGRELPLTERGRRQASAVAERLAERPVAAVYASPYRRALETAAIVAARLGREVIEVDDLQEVKAGDLAGRRDPAAHTIYNGVYRAWLAGELDARFPGGETLREAVARFRAFLDTVAARGDSQDVVAVSHGGMPETVMPLLLELPPEVSRHVELGAITTLRLDAGGVWRVDAGDWGAVDHLDGL